MVPGSRFAIPDLVQRRAMAEGESGRAWLSGLDDTLASLERDSSLSIGDAIAGGSAAFVAEARNARGGACIIKVSTPATAMERKEADFLQAAGGKGYARPLNHDATRNALLLEKLGARLDTLELSYQQQIDIMCATLLDAWRSLPEGTAYPSGAEKANSLASGILDMWRNSGQPCSTAVIETALRYCHERATLYRPEAAVLAHGDPHPANILAVPDTDPAQFKFIDPDGLAIEPAYDLGVLLRAWNEGLKGRHAHDVARSRARHLTQRTLVPAEAIWQWGYIERVSTGLLLLQLGNVGEGREFLDVSQALLVP